MKALALTVACGLLAAVAAGSSQSSTTGFRGKNGRIVFNDRQGRLVLVNPDGTGVVPIARTNAADWVIGASFSPDGRLIAYSRYASTDPDVFVIRPDGSGQRQVTFSRGADVDPAWSPEGTRIAFETNRNGNIDIYSVDANGTDSTRLTSSPEDETDPAWSPSGDRIAYTVGAAGGGSKQIWVMNRDGSDKRQLTSSAGVSENPGWSPDGRWIAFDSDRAERGDLEVYKMRADGSDVRRLTTSPSLDALPAFSPDGRLIVFVSDRAAKDSRKLFVVGAEGGLPRRLIAASTGSTYEMVPDWQAVRAPDSCTIRGTIHADQLRGSAKREVICGLGGNDVIDARDGRADTVDGGAGRDRALVDRFDRVRNVERVQRR